MRKLCNLSAILMTIWLLSGCAAALVGGAAAGGYYVGTDERDVGQITKDASITASINTKFVRDDYIKTFDINVDTYNGVVQLYGNVDSNKVAKRAVQLATSVKGVKKVESKLVVIQ